MLAPRGPAAAAVRAPRHLPGALPLRPQLIIKAEDAELLALTSSARLALTTSGVECVARLELLDAELELAEEQAERERAERATAAEAADDRRERLENRCFRCGCCEFWGALRGAVNPVPVLAQLPVKPGSSQT